MEALDNSVRSPTIRPMRQRSDIVWKHLRSGRRRRQEDIAMTPIMNLFIVLIPFLLMSATFVEYAMVQNALTEAGTQVSPKTLKLNLVVKFDGSRIEVTSRSCDLKHVMKSGERKAGRGRLPFTIDEYEKLEESLVKLKRAFPEEASLALAPSATVPYKRVIALMDRLRSRRSSDQGEVALFPDISFVKLPEPKK